jgi:hypothetical protein
MPCSNTASSEDAFSGGYALEGEYEFIPSEPKKAG